MNSQADYCTSCGFEEEEYQTGVKCPNCRVQYCVECDDAWGTWILQPRQQDTFNDYFCQWYEYDTLPCPDCWGDM